MKKTLLICLVLVLVLVSTGSAVLAMEPFFTPAICSIADGYPSAWGVLCLVAWLMDMWLDPLDGTPR